MVDVAPQMHHDMLASVYTRSDQFDLVHAENIVLQQRDVEPIFHRDRFAQVRIA